MARMNSDLRKIAVMILNERQKKDCEKNKIEYAGPYCERGGYRKMHPDGKPCRGGIVIHHRDNNNSNNPLDGSNWEYLCKSQNAKEDPRGITLRRDLKTVDYKGLKVSLKRVRDKRGSDDFEELKVSTIETEKNKRCEGVFRQCVEMIIDAQTEVKASALSEAGAEYTTQTFGPGNGIDQQTGMRYLRKMCAPFVGKYEMFEKDRGGGKVEWWVRKI